MTTYSPAAEAYVQSIGYTPQAIVANFALGADAAQVMAAFDAGHAAALASVAPVQPRVISTAAELDALPVKSAVQDRDGSFWLKLMEGAEECWLLDIGRDYEESAWLVQFGPFTLLAPVPATTEPERLTDPDDPRIKPGARVRLTIDYDVVDEHEVAYQYQASSLRARIRRPTVATTPDHEHWYLLAEAPDPDAELVARLVEVGLEDGDRARDLLTDLRSAGYDVTKRADA